MINKNTLLSIVLGVLLLVALLQFFQISSIDSPTTAVSVKTQDTPLKQTPLQEQAAPLQQQATPLPLAVDTTKVGCGI